MRSSPGLLQGTKMEKLGLTPSSHSRSSLYINRRRHHDQDDTIPPPYSALTSNFISNTQVNTNHH